MNDRILDDCRRLKDLLEKPEPGCAAWHWACRMVSRRLAQAIAETNGDAYTAKAIAP